MSSVRPDCAPSRRRLLRGLSGGLLAMSAIPLLALPGCGSSDPTYYTLTPWPGLVTGGETLAVELRTPSVASFLDRDTIVRNDRDYRLSLAGNAAWASDLPDMIGRTLALDLGQRLPGSTVYVQTGAISADPVAVIELDVSRFMENGSGEAEIEATLALSRSGGLVQSRTLRVARKPADKSMGALVAALSALLGQIADVAAGALRALPPAPLSGSSG